MGLMLGFFIVFDGLGLLSRLWLGFTNQTFSFLLQGYEAFVDLIIYVRHPAPKPHQTT